MKASAGVLVFWVQIPSSELKGRAVAKMLNHRVARTPAFNELGGKGGRSGRAETRAPALSNPALQRLSLLGVGPYLAVDALDEALAVLGALLEFAHPPELLDGKVVELPGDLRDGQPLVVLGFQGGVHTGT